jgi:hypothetical protein
VTICLSIESTGEWPIITDSICIGGSARRCTKGGLKKARDPLQGGERLGPIKSCRIVAKATLIPSFGGSETAGGGALDFLRPPFVLRTVVSINTLRCNGPKPQKYREGSDHFLYDSLTFGLW